MSTSSATSSITSALSLVNGRGMSSSDRIGSPPTRTSKQPLRGFSGLIDTLASGFAARMNFSSFVDRVLNAPQLLHASMTTSISPEAAAAFLAGALETALAFFELPSASAAERFLVPFFGGIIVC